MGDMFVKPVLGTRSGSKTTTVNDYATVPDADGNAFIFVKGYKSKIIEFKCTLNNLTWSLDVSLDATTWHNKKTDQALLKDASTYETLSEPWNYLRVQVKPTVGGSHGKLDVKVEMSSL